MLWMHGERHILLHDAADPHNFSTLSAASFTAFDERSRSVPRMPSSTGLADVDANTARKRATFIMAMTSSVEEF